jgi:hypothetical protein
MKNLKDKKITMATFKSFIKNAGDLFVETKSSFNGMFDGVEYFDKTEMVPVSKADAIGHKGVWCVGSSRDYFKYKEREGYVGIEVYNCCGCEILWTKIK